ncbi:MAG: hypothetical protein KDD38_10465 [Bdellovibrionales bacterium]|nr:hypothetical protein [Bdellovibrionales bacterium]
MKKVLMLMALILLSLPSFGSSSFDTMGDDLFPWPWGTECPFPWSDISGLYKVQSKEGGQFSRHYLVFDVSDSSREDLKFLTIRQYDRNGVLYAGGRGYSQKDQRVVRGVLSPENGDPDYAVIVRSYVKDTGAVCRGENLVTAATFCPLRGKKCMEDSNYVLEKMKTY